MYFTFSKELSFGLDSTSQEYTLDIISENVITNVNYSKFKEYNDPAFSHRYPTIKTQEGRIETELTYGNEGWNLILECLIGQRISLPDYSFARSSEGWNIVTGMLEDDLNSTDTNFTITEYKSGEFDNVAGVIIGSEYIAVNTISAGIVTLSVRAAEGSSAVIHSRYDIVYGVVVNAGKTIDLISRYKNGFSYELPSSITALINRMGDYFKFNGGRFSDFVFVASPQDQVLDTSLEFIGINTNVINLSSPSSSVDSEEMVSFDDINCYCMNQYLDLEKIYFQVSNTLNKVSSKFFDTTYGKILLSNFSAYGQFSLVKESIDAYNSYIHDDFKNLSITMCDSKQFEKAYVFAFNNTRYGTMLHVLGSNTRIVDSVPFFSFGPGNFTILIQY